MADVPFLGCKISLISKCDIRYEGILYCVDAKESTIALSKVKSYGTETRGDPSCYVAPKNEVYDIIIFRASDVKDLRVDAPEPPGLSDPAIISAHHSYPAQSPSTSSFSNTGSNNLTTNNITSAPGSGQQANSLNSNVSLANLGSSTAAAVLGNQHNKLHQQQQQHPSRQHQQPQQQHQKPLLPFLPAGAKDQQQQQHPNNVISNQASQQQQQQSQQPAINYSSAVTNSRGRARPEARDKRVDAEPKKPAHESARDNNNRHLDRRPVDNKREEGVNHDERPNERRDDRRNDRRQEPRNGPNDRKVDDRRPDGPRPNNNNNNQRNPRANYDNRNHPGPNVRYNNNNNNNNNSNYQPRRRPSSRDHKGGGGGEGGGRPNYRRPPMYNQRRPRSGDRIGAPRPPRKTAPLKFEGEYDFEVANKLFLELDGKFKNLKLKGDERDGESSGDGVTSKSPAGQSESGSGYDSDDHNNKDRDSKDGYGESVSGEFYDRTKSFFDSISCEASERSQGKVNKTDWRKERQTNAETFGVSTSYRSRGGYRGRVYGANGYHNRR